MFANLSYRFKIPLALTAVILMTEIVLTAALLTRALADAKRDMQSSANSLAKTLSWTVREPLVKDDLWRAFEIVRAPVATKDLSSPLRDIVVLDTRQRVYASSSPKKFPFGMDRASLPREMVLALQGVSGNESEFQFDFPGYFSDEDATGAMRVISEDGSALGFVLLSYDAQRLYDRVALVLLEVAAISVPGLLILVPLGWIWGNRMAKPLSRLADVMAKVGREPPQALAANVEPKGSDEIGQLAGQFRDMLNQLAEKEALEHQVVVAERLAAVGRVSAGIAHEINNPLGGMLNAVDTLSRHGNVDAFTEKTLGLLRRGLAQIRATVGALLLEAKIDSPAMHGADWQDLKTLIAPQLAAKQVHLSWEVRVNESVPLPAHLVRQLGLNLLLNAAKAVEHEGKVGVEVSLDEARLSIRICNSGQHIPMDALGRLFEPYQPDAKTGSGRTFGLGLWVSYQIVTQLGGTISTSSAPGYTLFEVLLPVKTQTDARSPALSD
ncbi:MAG TPA: HAMP domain-containing sensor histidine kinase [Burkholderiales bacterium]|nr:HAMP domain-containing sensor histidine kinase [Burkholderiales bacterium]